MIEPALSAKEWEEWLDREWTGTRSCAYIGDNVYGYAALIAVANHALPDSDPAKITRERITLLRTATDNEQVWMELDALADALERYLPPE